MKPDWTDPVGPALPVDVTSRLAGMFELVNEVSAQVKDSPVISNLLRDFKEMTRAYTVRFETALSRRGVLEPGEKWLRRHEMLDKLTREWHVIYSLASATQLGSAVLGTYQPFVDQAVQDIGIDDPGDRFLLIPTFGESFSLVTVRYSTSNVAILKLPISVIHSPWELSVIWHEMAGLKVLRIGKQVDAFLDDFAGSKHVARLEPPGPRGGDLINELLQRIRNDRELDAGFIGNLKAFLSDPNGEGMHQETIWSKDWFEQLYEDACSVFAFGDAFVPVLDKILRRQAHKLTPDRRHPDLETRLAVARRLLQLRRAELRKGDAPAPVTDPERLTDELLWAFIQKHRDDPVAGLPVAFADPAEMPEVRRDLVQKMTFFIEQFGDFAETPVDFGAMAGFEEPASEKVQRAVVSDDRSALVQERLDDIFGDSDLKALITKPFSPSDELEFYEHAADADFQTLHLGGASSHGGHYVLHLSHG